MIYSFLADVVVVLHFLFVLFALLGGLTLLWRRWMIFVHLPVVAWASLIELIGWTCPLTPLEQSLRAASGSGTYQVGFIEHYLIPILYPPGLTPTVEIVLGLVVLVINVIVYAGVIRRLRRRGNSE